MANRERPVRRNVIQASLRKQILDGRWGPGAYLPSEADLGRRFRASRVTIRAALKLLRADGLVQTQPGIGWCVGTPRSALRERPVEFLATPFPTAGYVFDGVRRYLDEAGLHLPTHLTPVEHFAKDARPLSERIDLRKAGGLIFFSPTPLPRTQVEEARAARVPIVCAGLAAHADHVVDRQPGFNRDFLPGGVDFQVAVQAEVAHHRDAQPGVFIGDIMETRGIHGLSLSS